MYILYGILDWCISMMCTAPEITYFYVYFIIQLFVANLVLYAYAWIMFLYVLFL
jgi:hypothetical protein